MPWIRAKLRGQTVFARVDETGAFVSEGGRVEIRYRRDDGRLYRAIPANLVPADTTVLPDDHCAEADPVDKAQPTAGAPTTSSKKGRARPGGLPSKAAASRLPTPETPPGVVVVYADGACSSNPGPAGLGVVVAGDDESVELSEYLGIGTNNIAELTAILRALDELGKRPARIHTDSQYSIGVLQRGWRAKANQELVAELRRRLAAHGAVELVYVPGHSGVPLNERADALARDSIAHRTTRRTVVPAARRPTSAARGKARITTPSDEA